MPARAPTVVLGSTRCPICGEQNTCAMEIARETGNPPEHCWCMDAVFSPETLSRIPADALDTACICARCAAQAPPPR